MKKISKNNQLPNNLCYQNDVNVVGYSVEREFKIT